eukprot:TRINITY_DN32910_c0_g1_i1.p1 TRINITY_DN32910_c0_g1~~TRINITY_DN32910_c0_g1_i1.p1  ORF type:complete len:834 (-),score=127.23 TRINITY_DN32910_c0_g1_i1:7-2508(-)
MRALEIARSLRAGADPVLASVHFLKCLASNFAIDDAAVLTERFTHTVPRPPPSFFVEVAAHVEIAVRAGGHVSAPSVVEFADAFARARTTDAVRTLGLVCLAAPRDNGVAPADLIRLASACEKLGAQDDPGVRGFLLMRLQAVASKLEARSLAECASLLARLGIFSPHLSDAIEHCLVDNPWMFDLPDALKLLPHYNAWRLGPLHKRAFQSLGNRLSECAEFLSPQEALDVIDCFAQVGSVHEVLHQHMHLALLLERGFTELDDRGIAKLVVSMSKVEFYHTGLLREIVLHIQEKPTLVAQWQADDISGFLRTVGLAPVFVPDPLLQLMGCRFATLLPQMDENAMRDLFEVSSRNPQLLRAILNRGGGRALSRQLDLCLPRWSPGACSDVVLAMVLALDLSPLESANAGLCACMVQTDETSASAESRPGKSEFRSPQPEEQLQVVLKSARTYKEKMDTSGEVHFSHTTRKLLKNLFLVDREDEGDVIGASFRRSNRKCRAPWALTGRRGRLPAGGIDTGALLASALENLQGRLMEGSEIFAELRDSPSPSSLLEPVKDEVVGRITSSSVSLDDTATQKAFPTGDAPPVMPAPAVAVAPAVSPEDHATGALVLHGGAGSYVRSFWREGDVDPEKKAHRFEGNTASGGRDAEKSVLRRSELLEVAAQTFASLRLCFGPRAPVPFDRLPRSCFTALAGLLPVASHLLRPGRQDDKVAMKYHLGPLRLEAFVRRPDEPLLLDVFKTVRRIMPYLPRMLGWETWPARRQDYLDGVLTGGGFLSLVREVEVPPFVICMVLRPSRAGRRAGREAVASTTALLIDDGRCGESTEPEAAMPG